MPASTREPPGATWAHSKGASTRSGVARMLASTVWYCPCALSATPHSAARGWLRRWQRVDDTAASSMSTASMACAPNLARQWPECQSHSRSPARAGPPGAMAGNPAQAHAGGGVRAGAKRQARVQPDDLTGLRGRLVPGGHDPEFGVISTGANCDCVRRTQSWSGTGATPSTLQPSKKSCACSKTPLRRLPPSAWKQRQHPRALPALLGRWHAGLAKQGLFGVGLGVGVFHRHAQCIQRLQRIAQRFNPVFGSASRRSSNIIACDATATLQGSGCWCRRS
jgi:hypothetical protein